MRKHLSKLAVLLLAALMLIGFSATALADDDNASLPHTTGSLTIHKYLMDDITSAGPSNDGTEIATLPSGAKPINGIEFKLYQIAIPATGTDAGKVPEDGDYVLDSMLDPTTLTSDGVVFTVTAATTPSITTAGGTEAAPAGIATASNLPQGIYLVVEQPNEAVASPAAPFVVAVPMTEADGDGWIRDVHVYPKNEDLSTAKVPSITSVELGETVTWTIVTSIPFDIAAAKAFSITDTLDSALDFVSGTVVVEGLAAKDAASGTAIAESGNWTVDLAAATNKLTVAFTEDGFDALDDYKFVKITFDTTVNDDILDNLDLTVQNESQVHYTNRYDQDKERETPKTKIHTGKIKIDKTDANSGAMLIDAQFKIASSEANAKAGHYLRKTATGAIVDFGETDYAAATDWVETTAADATETSKAYAVFAGLKDYTESGTTKTYLSYWLVETKAPSGYNLLAAPVKVDFTAANSSEDTDYTVTQPIKNTTDFTLPKTGGTGTLLFTIGGIVLIGLSAVLLVATKKKKQATR